MSGRSLIPEQRRREILACLRAEPVQSYQQLAKEIGVSHMTIRRDAAVLAEQSRVRLTQGGVAAVHSTVAEPSRIAKAAVHTAEKNAIATAAAELVGDSTVIYLDAGTTIAMMVPRLRDLHDLTIVTNDLSIAMQLLDYRNVDLIMIGGRVATANHSTIGRLAAMTLAELSIDLAFVSCSSWDIKHGLTTPVEAKIELKRTAITAASQSILLADTAKFGSFSKYRVACLGELDTIITDDGLDRADVERLRTLGNELIMLET